MVYEASPAYFGVIAQLGERRTGSAEVGGSIPPGSTNHEYLAAGDTSAYHRGTHTGHPGSSPRAALDGLGLAERVAPDQR
jgi:hypothetical protein